MTVEKLIYTFYLTNPIKRKTGRVSSSFTRPVFNINVQQYFYLLILSFFTFEYLLYTFFPAESFLYARTLTQQVLPFFRFLMVQLVLLVVFFVTDFLNFLSVEQEISYPFAPDTFLYFSAICLLLLFFAEVSSVLFTLIFSHFAQRVQFFFVPFLMVVIFFLNFLSVYQPLNA